MVQQIGVLKKDRKDNILRNILYISTKFKNFAVF